MIESMIERLLAEAGEEADGKAFCETETEKSKTKQHELSQKADMHQVAGLWGLWGKSLCPSELPCRLVSPLCMEPRVLRSLCRIVFSGLCMQPPTCQAML